MAPQSLALARRFRKFSIRLAPNQILPWATSWVVLVAAVSIQYRGKTENSATITRKM